jgi:hypothetical protein
MRMSRRFSTPYKPFSRHLFNTSPFKLRRKTLSRPLTITTTTITDMKVMVVAAAAHLYHRDHQYPRRQRRLPRRVALLRLHSIPLLVSSLDPPFHPGREARPFHLCK